MILDSIDRASDPADRAAVVDAFFDTAARDSILGEYSIDAAGETTLGQMSGYELRAAAGAPGRRARGALVAAQRTRSRSAGSISG